MTDIIEVALNSGMAVAPSGNGYWDNKTQLQSFADHYRKEGAEESKQQLAATELVVEQTREALNKLVIQYESEYDQENIPFTRPDWLRRAMQLQPSLSALRDYIKKNW